MNSADFFSPFDTLEPRLFLDAGWSIDTFAQWYGGTSEAYGPESDIVVRVTSSDTYVTVGGQSTPGDLWSSNDFMIKTTGGGKRVLTDSDDDGKAPSLVETPNGYLRAIWYNATEQSLMFAAEGHTSWESNSPMTLDSGNVGEWSDMALEGDGDLHVVYYDRTNGQMKYAYHATADEWYSWTIETIDTVGDISSGLAMAEVAAVAVDSSGTPHVAYYSETGTQLEYAYRTGADTWVNTVLDSDGVVGTNPSIAVDGSDVVHLVYYDTSDLTLRYDTKTGGGWTGAQVVEAPTGSAEPFGPNALALDALGNPHIAYTYQLSTNGKNLKHAWIDTGAWTNETVDSDGTGQHGYYPKMTITQGGHAYISYGINWANSIYVADKADVGEPGGPDLAVSISGAGGEQYIPGDKIPFEVVITNVGIEPAAGEVRLQVGVAIDTGSGLQYEVPYDKYILVDLAPGDSKTILISQLVPVEAMPGNIYQVATIDPDVSVGDTVAGNNEFMASTADEVIWALGDVNGRTVRTLTVEDEDGDLIKFNLAGAGSMSVTPNAEGIDQILITGTNSSSSIKITVSGDDGDTFVGNLIVEGDVSKIDAPHIFITGDVTINGFCKTLILGTVDVGHTITINGDQVPVDPADLKGNAVTLVFADVVGTTVNTNGLAIKSLKALDWDGGSITAPWIGSIQITGTKDGSFEGDLSIDLNLSGVGSPKQTLGTVKVADDISGGSWDITGNVGSIRADGADLWAFQVHSNLTSLYLKGVATNTQVDVDGLLASARAAEWHGGGITADALKTLTIAGSNILGLNGDCDMSITISGDEVVIGKSALGNVLIKGTATDTQLDVDGLVGPVRAGEWHGGGIRAYALKTLTIAGSNILGLDGDCDIAIALSGDNVVPGKTTVNTVTIKGIAALDMDVTGAVGNVKAAALDAATDLSISEWIRSIITTGEIAGTYTAGRIGLVKTRGDFTATFDLSQTPDPKVMALGTLNVAGRMVNAEIKTAGNIGMVQTGTLVDSSIFAGWDSAANNNGDGVLDLFDVGDTWTQQSFIKKLTIKGLPAEPYALDNSNVVASTLNKTYLTGDIMIDDPPGAEPFGFAVQGYDLFVMKSDGATTTWRDSEPISTDGNFAVRLV